MPVCENTSVLPLTNIKKLSAITGFFVFLTMHYIIGTSLHQMHISSLDDTIAPDN
jgi:hypothetical protein